MPWTLQTMKDTISRISTKRGRPRGDKTDGCAAKTEVPADTRSSSSEEYFDAEDELQPTGGKTLDRDQSEEKRTTTNQIYPQDKVNDNHQGQHDTKDQTGKNSQKHDTSKHRWGNTGQHPPRAKNEISQHATEDSKRHRSRSCDSKPDNCKTNIADGPRNNIGIGRRTSSSRSVSSVVLNDGTPSHKSKSVYQQQQSSEPPSRSEEDSTHPASLSTAEDTPKSGMNPEQTATTDVKSGKSCQEDNQYSDKWLGWFCQMGCWLGNWFVWFNLLVFGLFKGLRLRAQPTRKHSMYLCTSWGMSIRGLKEKLQTLSDPSRCVVQELELPYSRLEDFKFPSEVDKSDAIILCHSIQNRGFSITDVQDSIYDEFLKYCNQVFGKDHIVVVVHDFGFTKEALKGQMETFQSRQPMTFKMAGLVVLAGKLDDTEVQLCEDDLAQLQKFLKKCC